MAPFFRDFVDFAKRRYPNLYDTLEKIVSDLGAEPDLEALLSKLNAIVEIKQALPSDFDETQLEEWMSDALSLRSHLLAFIIERCENFDRGEAERLCTPFFKQLSPCSIFTTNYDRVPEHVCDVAGIELTDGFQKEPGVLVSPWNGDFNADRLLAKLHGSVTWYVDPAGDGEAFLQLDRGYPLPGPEFHLARGEHLLEPLMIVPTLEKQALSAPYNHLQNVFVDALATTRLLIVIGSSLRDDHLVGSIKFRSGTIVVLVVDRTASVISKRLAPMRLATLSVDVRDLLSVSTNALVSLAKSITSLPTPDDILQAVDEFVSTESTRIASTSGLTEEEREALARLAEPTVTAKLEGIARIRGSTHPQVVDAKRVLLSDANPEVRSAAAGSLGLAGAAEAVPELLRMSMDDPVPIVKIEAALALKEIGTNEALAALERRQTERPQDDYVSAAVEGPS